MDIKREPDEEPSKTDVGHWYEVPIKQETADNKVCNYESTRINVENVKVEVDFQQDRYICKYTEDVKGCLKIVDSTAECSFFRSEPSNQVSSYCDAANLRRGIDIEVAPFENHGVPIEYNPSAECDKIDNTQTIVDVFLRINRTFFYDRNFVCSICFIFFPSRHILKVHKAMHDGSPAVDDLRSSDGKPYVCDQCSYRSAHAYHLKRHKLVHSGEKPFACSLCTYRCANASNLKKHFMIHTGEKPLKCDQCNYKCADPGHFKTHKMIHRGEKPYACSVCEYKCTHLSNLITHNMIHTGVKPFSCDACEYRCSNASHLRRHKMVHGGVKPYKCDRCDYRCTVSSDLKRHGMTHSGEKPFGCGVCEFRCAISANLRRHERTHSSKSVGDINTTPPVLVCRK